MFAYFQRADYILTNLDGPLSTAVPVSTIRAATREVKAVLDYPARQRGRTLRWPSDANWVTVNPQKFSPQKLFSSNSRKFSPAIKTHYAVLAQTCLRAWLIGHTWCQLQVPQSHKKASTFEKALTFHFWITFLCTVKIYLKWAVHQQGFIQNPGKRGISSPPPRIMA